MQCKDIRMHNKQNFTQCHAFVVVSSKVCGHAICSWRHHGASHWLFNYQWSGDNLLLHQNYEEDNVSNEKIRYPGENVSKTRLEILYVICSS